MSARIIGILSIVAVLGMCAGNSFAQAKDGEVVKKSDNLVEVTVTGIGMTEKDALRDAQRKAVEQGAGVYIYSQSKTENFQLIKDTILSKSAGFVQSVEVISKKQLDDDSWTIKIKAVVSIKGIEDTWGVVVNLLKQMGRPKIMVFINEKTDDKLAEDSTVQTKIENLLLKNGFLLVDKKQIKDIDRKDLMAAVSEDKPDKVQAIAKRFGAQIFISGSADCALGEKKTVSGIALTLYGAKGNIRVYNSDTAQMIASQNANETSADRMANVAADKTLAALGDKIGPRVLEDILVHWQDCLEGRGEVKLEVEGMTFTQVSDLEDEMKKIKEIKDVNSDFANKIATYSIQSEINAKDLAKKIAKAFPSLDITDVTQNVIKATYKK